MAMKSLRCMHPWAIATLALGLLASPVAAAPRGSELLRDASPLWSTVNGPEPHVARELASGHVYVQLTEQLLDLEADYPKVAAARERIIEHLGRDAFFAPGRSEYRTPKFSFFPPGGEA